MEVLSEVKAQATDRTIIFCFNPYFNGSPFGRRAFAQDEKKIMAFQSLF